MVSWYGSPAIASDVVNSTSVCAHVEVTAVSRVKLHTEHVHRGAERCKGSGQGRKKKCHKNEHFIQRRGLSLGFVLPGSCHRWADHE